VTTIRVVNVPSHTTETEFNCCSACLGPAICNEFHMHATDVAYTGHFTIIWAGLQGQAAKFRAGTKLIEIQ